MNGARLAELASEGAADFDPEGFVFAERLVGAGRAERAEQWIAKLAAELRAARAAAEHAIEALLARGIEIDPALSTAHASGDYRAALRLAARLGRRHAGRASRTHWALSVSARASARGVRLPEELSFEVERLRRSPAATSEARALEVGQAVSRAMFVDSVASDRAALAIARATDNVPSESGPYNCRAIAARVLGEIAALSPDYAQTLVATLDDLAALDGLPIPAKAKSSGRRKQ